MIFILLGLAAICIGAFSLFMNNMTGIKKNEIMNWGMVVSGIILIVSPFILKQLGISIL